MRQDILKGVAVLYCQVKSFEVHFNIERFKFRFVVLCIPCNAPHASLSSLSNSNIQQVNINIFIWKIDKLSL